MSRSTINESDTTDSLLSEYCSKKAVAREFEVSERTVERWVRLRLLPAPIKIGRTRLYHIPTIRESLAKLGNPRRRR